MTFREVMRNKTIEEVRSTLAMNLRTIRLSKGIAQERLALDAGVDRTVVSKIERAVTNPSIEILLKLANQLDVDLTDFCKLASCVDGSQPQTLEKVFYSSPPMSQFLEQN